MIRSLFCAVHAPIPIVALWPTLMSMHSITADQLVVLLIINEMKALELWKGRTPEWITNYKPWLAQHDQQNFCEWMQFVFLPNRFVGAKKNTESITLQAKRYFQQDITKGKLLQLLIELDNNYEPYEK